MRRYRLFGWCIFLFFYVSLVPAQANAASLTLAWDPPTDSNTAGYILHYGTAPGRYTSRITVGLVTSHRVDGLAVGTKYYFAVQAYNWPGVVGNLSAEVSGAPQEGAGTEPYVGAAAKYDNGYLNISWGAVPGVQAYRVEVGSAPGRTAYSAVTTSTSIVFDPANLSGPLYYYARVRAIIDGQPAGSSNELVVPASEVTTGAPTSGTSGSACVGPPENPRHLSAGATGNSAWVLWQPRGGATIYYLVVGSASGLQDLAVAGVPPAAGGIRANAADGFYALRLVAVNDCGPSVWAAETTLTVGALPAPPGALTHRIDGTTVTLSWTAPPSGPEVTRYLVEVITPQGPVSVDTGNTGTVFVHHNTPPGKYTVTVRAGAPSGFGPSSERVTVVVP